MAHCMRAVSLPFAALPSLQCREPQLNSPRRKKWCRSLVPHASTLFIANSSKTDGETNAGAGAEVAVNRREAIGLCGLAVSLGLLPSGETNVALAAGGLPEEEKPRLCDVGCEKDLEDIPTQTTPSGLQYKDIVVGKGPSPPKGFQVAANYVAMIPTGKIFDSSLEKGLPYIFRVGADQVIKGLDEGISSMKVGGKRRLYIPGELAFPKGLNAAAGRPRVPPSSPVIFDVDLLYVPGLEDEFEEESPTAAASSSDDVEEEETETASL